MKGTVRAETVLREVRSRNRNRFKMAQFRITDLEIQQSSNVHKKSKNE